VTTSAKPLAKTGELGGAPLTHLTLLHCADIEVLAQLPRSLLHLDLRGASLQVPDAALPRWTPLSRCEQLTTLCLAGNKFLSAPALEACINSLPKSKLRVLDLSETHADRHLFETLPSSQQVLTHLSLSMCSALDNNALAALLVNLPNIEALNIAECHALEQPFSDIEFPNPNLATNLRLLGVGHTAFAVNLELTRRALGHVAPNAFATVQNLDIFSYNVLPPCIL